MADLATLGLVFETRGGEQAARVLDQVEQKAGAAERATDSLAGSQMRAGRATDELAGGAARTSRATDALAADLNKATAATVRMEAASHAAAVAQTRLNAAQVSTIAGSRLATHEMINLSRQLGDVATMAAMGASPLMILTTQGAQIGEVFGIARQRGVGFGAALGQMGGAITGVLVKLAPVTLAVGAVVGAFALFERAVDKNTEGATTWGQTWQATVNVVGEAIMSGPIGEGLNWLGQYFNAILDSMVGGVTWFADNLVGHFVAAYQLIVKNWRQLPQVFGVILQGSANIAIQAVEGMVNRVIDGVNHVLERAGKAAIAHVNLPEIRLAPRALTADYERMGAAATGASRAGREAFVGRIVSETERLAAVTSEAADNTERHARAINGQAEALDEANPAIERSIQNLEMLVKRNADLTMSPLQKAMAEQRRLLAEAEAGGLADVISATQILTDMEVERVRVVEAINVEFQRMPTEIAASVSPLDNMRASFEQVEAATRDIRFGIDDVARAIESKDWAGVFGGLIRTLQTVKELWNSGQPGGRSSAAGAVLSTVGGAVGGTAGGVISGIGSGFSAAGSLTSMGAAATGAGMTGLGSAIGAMAGPIGIAVAGFSILSKVLSDGAAKRRAKAEQEANDIQNAAAIARERENTRARLEIELLRASGNELAAVTRERENELRALDSVSAAIQRQIYTLQDWARTVAEAESAVSAAESLVAQAEDNLLRAYEIERDRLNVIIDGVKEAQATLRSVYEAERDRLKSIVDGVKDAQAALRSVYEVERDRLQGIIEGVDGARQALQEAYFRERSAIEETVSSVEGLIETLKGFRRELDLNPLAQGSPSQGRDAALTQFQASGAVDAPGTGRAFLDASLASARTMAEFQRDRAMVARAIDDLTATAETQLTDAEKQLAALDKQVSGLLAVNDNVLSVADAIGALETAEAAAAKASDQLKRLDDQVGALIDLKAGVLTVEQAILALATAEQQAQEAKGQLDALEKQVGALIDLNAGFMTVEQAIRNLETAEQAAAVATAQLAALDAQVGALINLNSSFMSVASAIAGLASAQQSLADAQAALATAQAGQQAAQQSAPSAGAAAFEIVGAAGYVDRNPDLAALFASGTGMARGRSKEEFGLYHFQRYGQGEDRFFRPFADGGMFSGGMVSGPTAFPMGVMGEAGPEAIMPLANVGGRLGVVAANDGLKDEVRALRQEMAAMRLASERTAKASEDSRDVLEGAARGQLSITTEAA